MIYSFEKYLPNWLRIIHNKKGLIVKINTDMKMRSIKEKLIDCINY